MILRRLPTVVTGRPEHDPRAVEVAACDRVACVVDRPADAAEVAHTGHAGVVDDGGDGALGELSQARVTP
jgi:Ethanolamine utilization protein EutJ (predicted chaperonin)